MVRINSLYTRTINSSIDSPASLKPLCSRSPRLSVVLFSRLSAPFFVLFIFFNLKKKALHRSSWSGSTLSSQWHLSPAGSERVNQESKRQTEEALNHVIRGRTDFQLSAHGTAFLAHQRIVQSVVEAH